MAELYLTIAEPAFSFTKEIKKSKFIVSLFRITSEVQAKQLIDELNQTHRKANHNVWAYVLGASDQVQRYSDDGEPSGTAGVPMLEVLKNNGLHDVIAIQTRYFGGIKLGAGGLIRAYAGTLADAIVAVGLVKRIQLTQVSVIVPYAQFEVLQYWLTQNEYVIQETKFTEAVEMLVLVAQQDTDQFKSLIQTQTNGIGQIQLGAATYADVPFNKTISAQTPTRQ
ncbi:YigZ family protein [Weissella diestrammenae]|uniref:YigZ family protein n=1 Tax=Weissella diestrammenae TaxID=1162633 RepID=A0A7G9T5G0_9LACO|nr:YigZ family protein [Weissella diestrammenae]MCM0583195.1 YigZ family protein [Weissella diestrammenae]QNN75335.1 YigZ family protein [Weissella diestrammenae]